MDHQSRGVLLKLALLAACTDSDARELSFVRRAAERLSVPGHENFALTLRDVQLGRCKPETLPPVRPEHRLLAYDMAVCICNADAAHNHAEHAFLEQLRLWLGLDVRSARSAEREANALTDVPLQPDPSAGPIATAHPAEEEALDRLIEDYAVHIAALAGAAQPRAVLTLLCARMKLVYRVAKAYGREAERGQIRNVLADAGVGMTAQCIEEYGRMLDEDPTQRRAQAWAETVAIGEVARAHYRGGAEAGLGLEDVHAAALGRAPAAFEQHREALREEEKRLQGSSLLVYLRRL